MKAVLSMIVLHDLQKAFDSVESPVLLDIFFSIDVDEKTWRIIKNWYGGCSCCVTLGDKLSNSFPWQFREACVRALYVLSPTLFLLVMNPLLKKKLESTNLTSVSELVICLLEGLFTLMTSELSPTECLLSQCRGFSLHIRKLSAIQSIQM